MTLSPQQRVGEIVALRTILRTNSSLRHRINEAIASEFQKDGIEIEKEITIDAILALPEEIADGLSAVVLPGGTNCAKL